MKRVSWRTNVDYSDDKFSIAVSSSFAYTKRNFQQSTGFSLQNPFLLSQLVPAYSRPYNADGSYATGTFIEPITLGANVLQKTNADKSYSDQVKALVALNMSYKINKELTAAFVAGIDFRETQSSRYTDKTTAYVVTNPNPTPTNQAGSQSESLTRYLQPNLRPSLNWKKCTVTNTN